MDHRSSRKMISPQHEMGTRSEEVGKYCTVEVWDINLDLSKVHTEILPCPNL